MAPKNLTPTFTDNAELQASLSTQYEAEANQVRGHLDHGKVDILSTLRGFQGEGFQFVVPNISIDPSEVVQENGYREPIGTKAIRLKAGDAEEILTITANKAGQYTVSAEGMPAVETTNTKRVDNAVQNWVIGMEEKYGFDTEPAMRQQQFSRTETAPGGPRPERK